MYMKLPWIDISKEFCQLEWENHLIAGYSHTRNSSEVFPVHNGHTICSKVYLFIVLKRCLGGHDSIFALFSWKISEKTHAQHIEKMMTRLITSHPGLLVALPLITFLIALLSKYMTQEQLAFPISYGTTRLFSYKNEQLWVMLKELILGAIFVQQIIQTSFLEFNHF